MQRYDLASFSLSLFFLLPLFIFISSNSVIIAQEPDPLDVPPPQTSVLKTDKERLNTETEAVDRTKLALDILESRLAAAETKFAASDYSGSYNELGRFQGVMLNTIDFLENKSLKNRLSALKRFEVSLRKMIPRIETIRRDIPVEYIPWLQSLVRSLRDTRERALQPLFSDTVVMVPRD